MSGLFGYDGYVYQTIIILHLFLEWALSDWGLSSVFIEVEDEEGEFSVDAILVSGDFKKVTHCEIKGGKFSASKCIEKLEKCSEYLKKNSLIIKNSEEEYRIVFRDDWQLSRKELKKYGQYLMHKPNDLHPNDFRKYRFGFTEIKSLEMILELIRKIVPNFDSDREKIRIYLNLSHFIETEVRALAEKLRKNSTTTKFIEIKLKDILNADDSFAEVITAKHPDLFKNKDTATQRLLEELNYGEAKTLKM